MRIPNSVALTQWSVRSTRSKRRIGWLVTTWWVEAGSVAAWPVVASGGDIVTSVRTPDPTVDVVATHFPVTRLDMLGELDAIQPLARLVAVHRRHVETDGAAVLVGELRALELVRDDHVVASRLIESEALGVRAVEGMEPHRGRGVLHAGAIEEVGQAHTLPLDLGHPPSRHALEIALEVSRWHRHELAIRQLEGLVDQAA